MADSGVLSPTQKRNLKRVVEKTEQFEQALASGQRIDEVVTDPTALEDLITRIIGANIGGAGAIGQVTGTPIVAAQAGSRFARQLAQRIPASRTKDILAEAIENPRLMAALLKKGKTRASRRQLSRQINAFILQTTIPGTDDESLVGQQ